MDIKSKSKKIKTENQKPANNENFFSENIGIFRNRINLISKNYVFVGIAFCLTVLLILSLFVKSNIYKNIEISENDTRNMMNTDFGNAFVNEIQRYANNLQRFFVHFDGYDTDIQNTFAMEEKYIQSFLQDYFTINNNTSSIIQSQALEVSEEVAIGRSISESQTLFDNFVSVVRALEDQRLDDTHRVVSELETLNLRFYDYAMVQNYLELENKFRYYIIDRETQIITTNISNAKNLSLEELRAEYTLSYKIDNEYFSYQFNEDTIFNHFQNAKLETYIFIENDVLDLVLTSDQDSLNENLVLQEMPDISQQYQNILDLKVKIGFQKRIFYIILVLLILAFLSMIFVFRDSLILILDFTSNFFIKHPITIFLIFYIPILVFFLDLMSSNSARIVYSLNDIVSKRSNLPLMFLALAFSIAFSCYLFQLIINKEYRSNVKEFKAIKNLRANIKFILRSGNHSLKLIAGIFLILIIASQVLVFLLSNLSREAIVLLEIGIIITMTLLFSLLLGLSKVNYKINQMLVGDFGSSEHEKGLFKSTLDNISVLGGGFQNVITEKNKSDKLRTELISNVSHDLKTPLTSIINYVDLLKLPSTKENDAATYINIIDAKSQKLKVLIDDLFEATKLSSGKVILEKENVDIIAIINQTLGELDELIEESSLTFRINSNIDKYEYPLDGRKIWRVFENIIVNITKYSQPGTRAYVDVLLSEHKLEIIFKNTSYSELNIDSDALFERFKRGDESRTTDGSGLGLSIAKDIISLHGGNIKIIIDGDLFKTIVTLPVLHDEIETEDEEI